MGEHLDALGARLAAAEAERDAERARAHDLYEAVENAVHYVVSVDDGMPNTDARAAFVETFHEHQAWFYDDARPWMQECGSDDDA